MAGLTLDSGALIAYERGDERIRTILRAITDRGTVPTVPAVVLAEVWRGGPRSARIARLLDVCRLQPLDERLAREAGVLLGRTPGAGTVDACVAVGALQRGDAVATSDGADLRALLGPAATILPV